MIDSINLSERLSDMSVINRRQFNRLSKVASDAMGTPTAFVIAVSLIVTWFFSGFYFKWSEGHSLLINTITTIVTFINTILLQSSQNRDSVAMQRKLDELIKSSSRARNEMIALELAEGNETEALKEEFIKLREEINDE